MNREEDCHWRCCRSSCDAWLADDKAMHKGCWPKAEVAENGNVDELGNLRPSDQEVDHTVAFMNTGDRRP